MALMRRNGWSAGIRRSGDTMENIEACLSSAPRMRRPYPDPIAESILVTQIDHERALVAASDARRAPALGPLRRSERRKVGLSTALDVTSTASSEAEWIPSEQGAR